MCSGGRPDDHEHDHSHDDEHGHAHDHGQPLDFAHAGRRPSGGAFMDNLRKPMPLGAKLRLVAKNTGRKIKLRQDCCDHPGEPGC